jgi:hypothetical protein
MAGGSSRHSAWREQGRERGRAYGKGLRRAIIILVPRFLWCFCRTCCSRIQILALGAFLLRRSSIISADQWERNSYFRKPFAYSDAGMQSGLTVSELMTV